MSVSGPPVLETIKLLSPLTHLEELELTSNKLVGTITTDVVIVTKLKKLGLANMRLDGKLLSTRSELHGRLASHLALSCTGVIPVELGQLVNLEQLDLSGNKAPLCAEAGGVLINLGGRGFQGACAQHPPWARCNVTF